MKQCLIAILIALMATALSCKQKAEQGKEFEIGPLKMTITEQNKLINSKGYDSETRCIVLNKRDTLHLEYGRKGIIFKLKEDVPTLLPLGQKQDIEDLSGHKLEGSHLIWVNEGERQYDADYGLFLKNYYRYDTVNGIIVKIVQPKKHGDGITGIYIPQLKDSNSFSMYGVNLDSTAQRETMEIIKSIKYK